MLHHPTLDKLQQLRLTGMHKALREQLTLPEIDALSFEERLGLLVDRELTEREDRRLQTRLRQARLKQSACLEDLDTRTPRGLDKALITQLATGQWIREALNLLHPRPHRRGQDLDRLRTRPPGLPPGLHHPLPARCRGCSRNCAWPMPTGASPSSCAASPRSTCIVLDDWGLDPPRCRGPARSAGTPR